MKDLNSQVQQAPFNIEGIHQLRDILRRVDELPKVNLKDASFVISLSSHDMYRKLLRFCSHGKMYQSKRLPVQTPTVWTVIGPMDLYHSYQYQCTKPVVTLLKTLGISIDFYIGNLLVMAPRKVDAPGLYYLALYYFYDFTVPTLL